MLGWEGGKAGIQSFTLNETADVGCQVNMSRQTGKFLVENVCESSSKTEASELSRGQSLGEGSGVSNSVRKSKGGCDSGLRGEDQWQTPQKNTMNKWRRCKREDSLRSLQWG